jgi:hypothetical protein
MNKYGFVYIWFDKKHKRYYIGCHWGTETDGYICSSNWMRDAYKRRPEDFKRRILKTELTREQMYIEEQRYFGMIKEEEIKIKYYNLSLSSKDPWHKHPLKNKSIGAKISAAKKGKSAGPCSPEKAKAISEAKKKAFAERGGMSEEHKEALRGIKKKPHTDDWKDQNSDRMKQQWSDPNSKRRLAVSAAAKKRWAEYRKNKETLNMIERIP